jgi:hypothetical protein
MAIEKEPLFYRKERMIFQRPVTGENGNVTLGFWVCTVSENLEDSAVDHVVSALNAYET